jgi:hypothetical protein
MEKKKRWDIIYIINFFLICNKKIAAESQNVVLTKREKNFFPHEGHLYWFEKSSSKDDSLKFWKCSHYRSSDCPARIHTRDGAVVKTLNDHTHASDPIAIDVTKVRNSIKVRAKETPAEVKILFYYK